MQGRAGATITPSTIWPIRMTLSDVSPARA